MKTDEELAYGIQQGKRDDLAVLIERHYSPVKGYLYRMCGDVLLSEDMVQEAFFRVLRRIDTYIYPRPFKPWLYTIAGNLLHSHFQRSDTQRVQTMDENYWETVEMDTTAPESTITEDETLRDVVSALEKLSLLHREVIVLRYVQELSLAEIAAALDVPVGTVKSRLNNALKHLRQEIEKVNG